jgi:hypothetical protein
MALNLQVLAHVDAPGVVGPARQEAIGADFDGRAVDESAV